jgi:hypothetical protein
MKDFTRQPHVVEFKIDQDIFRGKPFLAAQTMIDFTLKVDSIGDDVTAEQGFDTMKEALQLVMGPDDYRKFLDRMRDPNEDRGEPAEVVLARIKDAVFQAINGGSMTVPTTVLADLLAPKDSQPAEPTDPDKPPIELPQVNEVLEYLMEAYGMRPPEQAPPSSTGPSSLGTGTNSTDSSSAEASVSSILQPTNS